MYKVTMYKVQRILISLLFVMLSISLSAGNFSADSLLLDAYKKEDMSLWKTYVDSLSLLHSFTPSLLTYEYGFCGYMVDRDKPHALPYVTRFKEHVEAQKKTLPAGHYEMYRSAVLVFELRLHESIHPVKSMSLAKEAVKLAPKDPIVLTYYGTCLFYAPKPFGSKEEALIWFEKADKYFRAPQWKFCWLKEANSMYIKQCKDKLQKDKK